MPNFKTPLLLALAASSTLASPLSRRGSGCMTKNDAQLVVSNYAQLLRNYTDAGAQVALSPDFTDYAESVNSLINTCPEAGAQQVPLMGATFTSLTEFEAGQGSQPAIDFIQMGIWHSCRTAIVRWQTTNTAPDEAKPKPVVGIIVLEVEKAPEGNMYPWLIKEVFSEFDSAVWVQNLQRAGLCPGGGSASPTLPVPASSAAPTSTGYAAPSWVPVGGPSATASASAAA